MKKFYYLLVLCSLSVSAKQLEISYFNFKTNFKNVNPILPKKIQKTCELNVVIGGTLDTPTSTFWVNEGFLNGTAPYTYLLDGKPSPDGYMFYAEKINSGLHLVEVTDANDCKGSATFYSLSLSISDFTLPNFKCYPNPVKNLVTISNTGEIDEINLISIAGNTLVTKKINSINSEIDLSNFSKGIYFLKIKSEGTEKTIKLIKE